MNNFLYSLIITLLAGFSTLFGVIPILFKFKNYNKIIYYSLTFSISIMMGLSIFDLIPEALNILFPIYKYNTFIIIFILLSLSYLIIKLISKININNSLYKLGIINMIILMLHNMPEGILTFLSSSFDRGLGLKMMIAISLHNIPEGIAISLPIYYGSGSIKKALKYTFISGFSEVIGGLIGYLIFRNNLNINIISIVLLIVSFLMIVLSIEEIYPKTKEYKYTSIIGYILGLIFVVLSLFI